MPPFNVVFTLTAKFDAVSFCADDNVTFIVCLLSTCAEAIFTAFRTVSLYFTVFFVPSVVVAVITVVPAPTATTSPNELTIATLSFEDFQVHFLFVASAGAMTGFNCSVFPTYILPLPFLNFIEVTYALTDTLQLAFLPEPSAATAVMTAEPPPAAVIRPLELTLATFILLLFHTTFLLLALLVPTEAFTTALFPFTSVSLLLVSFTIVTGCPAVTVITFFTLGSAFSDIVILAVPFFTFPALITPAVVTVAILLLLVTNFSSFAATFVLRANDFPALSVSVPAGRLLTVMLFTTVFFAVAAVVAASAVPGTFIPENISANARMTATAFMIFLYPFITLLLI